MRVFISADIEGITTTTLWDECTRGQSGYEVARQQMTAEVLAACEGAHDAGAELVLVKDAHGSGTNIDPFKLPEYVELIRSGYGSPWCMVDGVQDNFDAAIFIGYHSAAGREGNPLAHTLTRDPLWVKINGTKASEFTLYSYAAALAGVPTVFLSGDQMLCNDSENLHPMLKTVAVKMGYGAKTRSIQPALACTYIRETVKAALSQDLSNAICSLPSHFDFEVCYKEQTKAARMMNYPGFKKIDDNTIHMCTDNFMDILRAVVFIL